MKERITVEQIVGSRVLAENLRGRYRCCSLLNYPGLKSEKNCGMKGLARISREILDETLHGRKVDTFWESNSSIVLDIILIKHFCTVVLHFRNNYHHFSPPRVDEFHTYQEHHHITVLQSFKTSTPRSWFHR